MKYTKGPWFLDTMKDGSMLIQPREGFSICPVKQRDGFEQDIYNFKLMAAAPELLETLKYVLGRLPAHDTKSISQCNAAIAKAEGR